MIPRPQEDEIGITIGQRLQDKRVLGLTWEGSYKEMSCIVEVINFIFINWKLIFY